MASEGATVAVRTVVPPTGTSTEVLSSVTPVAGTTTLTSHFAVKPPSTVATVIVAVPAFRAVTFPSASTDATEASEEDQVTDVSFAFPGVTVHVRVETSPTAISRTSLSSSTPVGWMVEETSNAMLSETSEPPPMAQSEYSPEARVFLKEPSMDPSDASMRGPR